jgi:hypothetical protein
MDTHIPAPRATNPLTPLDRILLFFAFFRFSNEFLIDTSTIRNAPNPFLCNAASRSNRQKSQISQPRFSNIRRTNTKVPRTCSPSRFGLCSKASLIATPAPSPVATEFSNREPVRAEFSVSHSSPATASKFLIGNFSGVFPMFLRPAHWSPIFPFPFSILFGSFPFSPALCGFPQSTRKVVLIRLGGRVRLHAKFRNTRLVVRRSVAEVHYTHGQ